MSTKKGSAASSVSSPVNRTRGSAAAGGATLTAADGLAGGSSFLRTEGSTRGTAASNKHAAASNFSKMVSQRSMRHGGKGARGGDDGRGSGSGRRSRKKKKDDQARVIVDGRDVTPQPLTFYGNAAMAASIATQLAGTAAAGAAAASGETPSGLDGADASAGFLGGALAHGGMSTLSAADSDAAGGGGSFMNYHGLDVGVGDDAAGGGGLGWGGGLAARLGMQFEYATDPSSGASAAPAKPREWSDKELREKHTIKIEETSTITLLHIPSTRIFDEDDPAQLDRDRKANRHYEQVLEKHKEKDKYSSRLVQTLNNSQREKEVQVAPPATRSVGGEASTWDLFDVEQRVQLQITAANLALNGHGAAPAAAGSNAATNSGAVGAASVPRIQHESDLIARTAHLAKTVAAAAAVAAATDKKGE